MVDQGEINEFNEIPELVKQQAADRVRSEVFDILHLEAVQRGDVPQPPLAHRPAQEDEARVVAEHVAELDGEAARPRRRPAPAPSARRLLSWAASARATTSARRPC